MINAQGVVAMKKCLLHLQRNGIQISSGTLLWKKWNSLSIQLKDMKFLKSQKPPYLFVKKVGSYFPLPNAELVKITN